MPRSCCTGRASHVWSPVAAAVVIPVQVLSAFVLLSAQPDRISFGVTGTVTPQYDSNSFATQLAAVIVVGARHRAARPPIVTAVCARIVADAYIGRDCDGRATRPARCGPRFFAIVGVSLVVLVSEAIGVVALSRRRARSRSRCSRSRSRY